MMIDDGNYSLVIHSLSSKKSHSSFSGAPAITIDNDENDPWNEYRDMFESNQSHMLNPSTGNPNYLLRHSSANTSLNESSSLDALAGNACTSLDGNHDDIFSIIEQAGLTIGKKRIDVLFWKYPSVFSEALTGSSSGDLLASTSGYHSYEPSPFNGRLKRSSILDPSAEEFHMDTDGLFPSKHRTSDQSNRRPSRTHTPTPLRIATSCK